MNSVDKLLCVIEKINGTKLPSLASDKVIKATECSYPGMPADLKQLYRRIGYGTIGETRYMVHMLIEPIDVFDIKIAEKLKGIVIVGDDFTGNMEAYDAKNGWQFGSIDANGVFEVYGEECESFIDFLLNWFSG